LDRRIKVTKIDELKTKELEEKINERMAHIKKIVDFIEMLVKEIGRQIHYDQGSSHTHIIRQAELGDFTFVADTGQTMMGGNDFSVWYHPGKKEIDIGVVDPVFSVYSQGSIEEVEEVKVSSFEPSGEWLTALYETIRRKDEILAKLKKEKKNAEKRSKLTEVEEERRKGLIELAKKLML